MSRVCRLAAALTVGALTLSACGGGSGSADGAAGGRQPPGPSALGSAPGPASPSGDLRPADFTFDRFDGRRGSLADYEGRPTVVNFFASWCAPCVSEMSDFEHVHRALSGRVAFLGVDVRDRLEDGQALATRTGVSYDLARDPQGDLLARVGGVVMPTTALFDAHGRLVKVHSGIYTSSALRAEIDRELLK
jgi:thiol-disulfide isomerase/thioredoxin